MRPVENKTVSRSVETDFFLHNLLHNENPHIFKAFSGFPQVNTLIITIKKQYMLPVRREIFEEELS